MNPIAMFCLSISSPKAQPTCDYPVIPSIDGSSTFRSPTVMVYLKVSLTCFDFCVLCFFRGGDDDCDEEASATGNMDRGGCDEKGVEDDDGTFDDTVGGDDERGGGDDDDTFDETTFK